MSGKRRGRPPGSTKKIKPLDAVGTPRIDTIFRRVARQQTREQVIQDSTVNNQEIIDATLNQLRANSVIRNTINNTKQSKFVINPINTGQIGIPSTFGGAEFNSGFRVINDNVSNTNMLALNVNSQRKRINNPSDIIDLDPEIIQSTIQSTEERPSDVQLLSSALSDGQSAVAEMVGLNLEQLLENNPILLDLIGQPQLNFEAAMNAYLNQVGMEEQRQQAPNNITITENNTNVIVPILEQHLDTQRVEMDLEAQLNKPILDTFTFASLEEESQGNLRLSLSLRSSPVPLASSQTINRNSIEFRGMEENQSSQTSRLGQSSNSVSSQQAQLQFDRYMEEFFASQPPPSSPQPIPLEPFVSQEATERVIDVDFDYVDLYLTNLTQNVLPPMNQTVSERGAVSLVRQLPIINRYLSLPAPSPNLNAESRPLNGSGQTNIARVRIRKPKGLSTLRGRRLANRRRQRNQIGSENLESNITTSNNLQLELIRERLRRLISRVAANSVEMDQMQYESPINLQSSSQLPSQFDFE